MRFAVLSDIHGNLAAFEAALADVQRQGVDLVVIAGDVVVGSPDSKACWDLATSLGYPILRGNHERYVFTYGTPDAEPVLNKPQFAPVGWARRQFTDSDVKKMRELPMSLRIEPDLLVVHASPRSDADSVFSHTPDEDLATMFGGESAVVRAHNHVGMTREWSGGVIFCCASVGLALDGHSTAQYVIAENDSEGWKIEHRSVPYDVDATLRRFRETGYLEETGPMGYLFMREVATGSHHVFPFIRFYRRLSETEGEVSLEDALRRFMGEMR